MIQTRYIVLDANILIRAVLGDKVIRLIKDYGDHVAFLTAEQCTLEAQKYLPDIIAKKTNIHSEHVLQILDNVLSTIHIIPTSSYEPYKEEACNRLDDPDDWPSVALALLFNCPVWTEDKDFFGVGIPTWRTKTVEHYLRD